MVLKWKKANLVTYNIAETETMLFSKSHCQRLNKKIASVNIKIGTEKINFNKKVIRWLGIWLDSQLKFIAHVNEKIQRAQIAKIQIKNLIQMCRLALAFISRIEIAAVQSIGLYGAELW